MVNMGFRWTRSTICALNAVYMVLGALMIGKAVWSSGFTLAASVNITRGVVTLGIFLILVSIMGTFSVLKHHQVLLFFFSAMLLLMVLFQVGVSCSCLTFSSEKQEQVLSESWRMMDADARRSLEQRMDCCGLISSSQDPDEFRLDASLCSAACKVKGFCYKCGDLILQDANETLTFLGGVGLIFSFSQILAAWLVLRYRNQKDPQTF